MGDEGLRRRLDQPPGRLGAQIGDLLRHRLLKVEAAHAVRNGGDQRAIGVEGHHVELDRILKIGQRIDDVIRRLHQPHRRMARMRPRKPRGLAHLLEGRALGGEDAELHPRPPAPRSARIGGFPGVFQEGGQRRDGQPHSPALAIAIGARQDAEALRIAVELREIGIEAEIAMATEEIRHPVGNHLLAGMAEGRVADVMRQAGGLHQIAELIRHAPDRGQHVAQLFARGETQRAADGGDFQRVHQPVADMRVGRQRVDLRLLLQAPEGAGEDDAVLIDLERAAMRALLRRVFGEAPRFEQAGPVHAMPFMRWLPAARCISPAGARRSRSCSGPAAAPPASPRRPSPARDRRPPPAPPCSPRPSPAHRGAAA